MTRRSVGFTSAAVLDTIVRLGAAMPDQIAAVIRGVVPHEVTLDDLLEVEHAIVALEAVGHVSRDLVRGTHRALRTADRWIYRAAKHRMEPGLLQGESISARVMVQLTRADGDRPIVWISEAALQAVAFRSLRPRHVRATLKRMVRLGFIERRRTLPAGYLDVVQPTSSGLREWRRVIPDAPTAMAGTPRPPRADELTHHLFVVASAISVLSEPGNTLIRLIGERELRSLAMRGAFTRIGDRYADIPDGHLEYTHDCGDGRGPRHRGVPIEVLVSKYTTPEIRRKFETDYAATARFVATTQRLAERVYRCTGAHVSVLPEKRGDPVFRAEAVNGATSVGAPPTYRPTQTATVPAALTARHIQRRVRNGVHDTDVLRMVERFHVLLIRQIVSAFHDMGHRTAEPARRTIRRLCRRGLVEIVPVNGPGIPRRLSAVMLGVHGLRPVLRTSAIPAPVVRLMRTDDYRHYCIQFAEVMLRRRREGWVSVPEDRRVAVLRDAAVARAAALLPRSDAETIINAVDRWVPPTFPLDVMRLVQGPAARIVLPARRDRPVAYWLSILPPCTALGFVAFELVESTAMLDERARQEICDWAAAQRLREWTAHAVPHAFRVDNERAPQ